MDLRKAYETLGLVRGASQAEAEAAHARLREDLERRLARIQAGPVAARYRELCGRLDAARDAILAAPASSPDEPLAHAFAVLGLRAGATPLDVASAYVSLCEEIDRELQDTPSEEMRRACLEARADVDAAYQRCALSPLQAQAEPAVSDGGSEPAHYETQMAAEPFEAPEPASPLAAGPVLRIEPEEDDRGERRRRRRRRVRRFARAASLLILLAGAGAGAVWWTGWWTDLDLRDVFDRYVGRALVSRLAPPAPPAELVEARTTAESLRKRLAEERVELQERMEAARQRAADLESSWSGPPDPAERERRAAELSRVRARRELAIQHADLAERYVLESPELTVAYGKMERADEQMERGDARAAVIAYSEARARLEASLAKLDLVEEAVGARSEAEAGLDAWRALAASADLGEPEAARKALAVLEGARELLASGRFEAAIPELRRAAQHFGVALAEGRKLAAARRADEQATTTAADVDAREATATAADVDAREATAAAAEEDVPVSDAATQAGAEALSAADPSTSDARMADASSGGGAVAVDPAPAREVTDVAARAVSDTPAVSAPPPALERASIKLVPVPAGEFFYGCDRDRPEACAAGELPGRRLSLGAFRIDRTEVRVNEYRECVDAGRCTPPGRDDGCNWAVPERGDHPVNCVDWSQARSYCSWVGKRLPTEREWEKAARGTDGRTYPWGDGAASCTRAVIAGGGAPGCGRGSTSPVGSRAEGRSPFGLFDMAGNVLEWTADAGEAGRRIARGGSWREDSTPARTFARETLPAATRDPRVGFRCAGDGGIYAVTSP